MSYATVQINLTDIDDDTLIEEIENRDYQVILHGQTDEDVEALHRTLDEIHTLYLKYVSDEDLDKCLKKFFENTIDMKVL